MGVHYPWFSWSLGLFMKFRLDLWVFCSTSNWVIYLCVVMFPYYYVVFVALGEVMTLLARWLHVLGGDNGIGNPSFAGKSTMIQFYFQINTVSMADLVTLNLEMSPWFNAVEVHIIFICAVLSILMKIFLCIASYTFSKS